MVPLSWWHKGIYVNMLFNFPDSEIAEEIRQFVKCLPCRFVYMSTQSQAYGNNVLDFESIVHR